jgi:SSS family solute:Na+ symporter
MSRLFMLLLTVAALIASAFLSSILDAYKYLGLLWGGVSTVLIARWYWWRVNPQSEIAALATSLTLSIILALFLPDVKDADGKLVTDYYTLRLMIVVFTSAIVWVIVAFATSKEPDERAIEFYKKMRIPGPGWRKVAEMTGVKPEEGQLLVATLGWIGCVALIIGLLIGVGKLLFHEWAQGATAIAIAGAGGILMALQFRKLTFNDTPSDSEPAAEAPVPAVEQ